MVWNFRWHVNIINELNLYTYAWIKLNMLECGAIGRSVLWAEVTTEPGYMETTTQDYRAVRIKTTSVDSWDFEFTSIYSMIRTACQPDQIASLYHAWLPKWWTPTVAKELVKSSYTIPVRRSHKLSQPYSNISAVWGANSGRQPGSSVLYHSTTTADNHDSWVPGGRKLGLSGSSCSHRPTCMTYVLYSPRADEIALMVCGLYQGRELVRCIYGVDIRL